MNFELLDNSDLGNTLDSRKLCNSRIGNVISDFNKSISIVLLGCVSHINNVDVFGSDIGTTPSRELYKFFDKEGNTLALRPDFTPSIARCAAKYFMDKNESLRFSYLGNAFTNVSNLQGKLKETTQMGVELIGDASVYADAEVLSVAIESLLNAGLTDFMVSVGNAEYFKGLCEEFAFSEERFSYLNIYYPFKKTALKKCSPFNYFFV